MSKKIRVARYVQVDYREGCDWTVFVNLNSHNPKARACQISELPLNVHEVRRARFATAAVASRVAIKMNLAKRS